MDIMSAETITTAITAAAGAAGTAVGRQAWEALLAVARRFARRGEPDADPATVSGRAVELAAVDPADERQVRELTALIIEGSGQDQDFAADLADWARQHAGVVQLNHGTVTNTVSGEARIGKLFQGRDFNITF